VVTRQHLIDMIASISSLIKTLLLIDNDNVRSHVLLYSIVRNAIDSKKLIGSWLTFMLQSPVKIVSHRAVDYLRLLSNAAEEDEEFKGKESRHDELPETLRALEDLITIKNLARQYHYQQ